MQDAYTEMQMQVEIVEVSSNGPCRGFITWAQGHSVTEFVGDVRGNQVCVCLRAVVCKCAVVE